MSTICHIVERALQREMDFCSRAVTIVPGIFLEQPRLLNKGGRRLLVIARINPMLSVISGCGHVSARIVGDDRTGEEASAQTATMIRRQRAGALMRGSLTGQSEFSGVDRNTGRAPERRHGKIPA
jgi:hypothetical protein